MNLFVQSVTLWVTNPASWLAPGPIAQFIGIALLVMCVLQSLDNDWAGGKLFSRKAAWITYLLMAIYIMVIFVIPFVGWTIGFAMLVILALVLVAFNRREAWKTQ